MKYRSRDRFAPIATFILAAAALMGSHAAAHAQAQNIVGVEVRGNKWISTDAVIAVVREKIGDPASDQQLAEDERSIRKLGFFHEVRGQQEPVAGGVKLIFSVLENPKITKIEISGNTKIPSAKLFTLMRSQVGTVFNTDTFEKDVTAIQNYYRDQGYVLARVTEAAAITPEGVVKLPIAEGWIESIKVSGNVKTKARTILRELDTKPGDVFCTKSLRDDLQRLRNLDFFENVNFQPAEGSEPGKVALVVDCKEKKTGTVSVGLGYSSRERLVGFADISEHNFRGIGQQIALRWEAGQFTNRSGYELSFTDPWMLGKRTSLGFSVYDRTTNRPLVMGGDTPVDTWIFEQRRGVGVNLGRPIGKNDRLLVDLRSDDVGYEPVDGYEAPPAEYLVSEGRVNSITLRGIRNTRDLDINPRRGCLYSTSAEFAGSVLGGEWSFTKLGMDLRRYFPIGKAKPDGSNQKVLAVRLMGGFSLGDLPLSENYWIGGSESLRGYREDEFHGDRMLLMSSELRIPFGANLQGVTFFDYGYAWPDGVAFNLGDLKPGVGVGLRVVTPLGPLRLDYGFGTQGGRSHFSIGHVF